MTVFLIESSKLCVVCKVIQDFFHQNVNPSISHMTVAIPTTDSRFNTLIVFIGNLENLNVSA